jgi:hypothetical protein
MLCYDRFALPIMSAGDASLGFQFAVRIIQHTLFSSQSDELSVLHVDTIKSHKDL